MISDGALSQDEIEALLKGSDEAFGGTETASDGNVDKQLFNEAAKIIADNQAFSLSSISTKTVTITNIATTIGTTTNLQQMRLAETLIISWAKKNLWLYLLL